MATLGICKVLSLKRDSYGKRLSLTSQRQALYLSNSNSKTRDIVNLDTTRSIANYQSYQVQKPTNCAKKKRRQLINVFATVSSTSENQKERVCCNLALYCVVILTWVCSGEIKNEETKSLIEQYLKGHTDLINKLDSVASSDKLPATAVSSAEGEVLFFFS